MSDINIIPNGDIKGHEESEFCYCHPRIEYEENGRIIIHNSFDGREFVEKAVREIEEKCNIKIKGGIFLCNRQTGR